MKASCWWQAATWCNLRTARWHGENTPYPWATAFNDYVKANLTWQGPAEAHPLVNYLEHEGGSLSNPTPEHSAAAVRAWRVGR